MKFFLYLKKNYSNPICKSKPEKMKLPVPINSTKILNAQESLLLFVKGEDQ